MADEYRDVMQGYGRAEHFAKIEAYEVQRTNHFEIVIDLPKLEGFEDAGTHLRMSTKSIQAPKVSAEPIPLKHGNDTIKVAAAPTFEDLTITVYDTLGVDQLGLIQAWFNKVFDKDTRLMGRVKDYKFNGTLYMYSPDGQTIRAWDLVGIWPKGFGAANDFSFDSSEAQNVTLDLSVDYYYEKVLQK